MEPGGEATAVFAVSEATQWGRGPTSLAFFLIDLLLSPILRT